MGEPIVTQDEAKKLNHGFVRLHWKEGGNSLAVVGSLHDGRRWFAPANWTAETPGGIGSIEWRMVERAEPLWITDEE